MTIKPGTPVAVFVRGKIVRGTLRGEVSTTKGRFYEIAEVLTGIIRKARPVHVTATGTADEPPTT